MIWFQGFMTLVALASLLVCIRYRKRDLKQANKELAALRVGLSFRLEPIPAGEYTSSGRTTPVVVGPDAVLGYDPRHRHWELRDREHSFYASDPIGFYPVVEQEFPFTLVDGVD